MIFPSLRSKRFGYVNLDMEAKLWLPDRFKSVDNPLLDPKFCNRLVKDVNKKYSLDYSFGGWMEDRSFLWRGSYMENDKRFIHLGVDFNVPAGTEVAVDFKAKVVKIDDDFPEDGGWGPRVIMKHATLPVYLIYAHLDQKIKCQVGDVINRGKVFAKVGKPPHNGNWFPHCHIQSISKKYFDELSQNDNWKELDGYGTEKEIKLNAIRFRDPLEYISLG